MANFTPGGTHLENGYGGVRPLRPPFHALSAVPYDPHFSTFPFFKTPFSTKIANFTKFAILEPKFTKISVPKPQILQNFSSKASNWAKIQFFKLLFFPRNQFFKPLFFMPDRSLSPHFRPFGPHTYTKMKVEYPPGFHMSKTEPYSM